MVWKKLLKNIGLGFGFESGFESFRFESRNRDSNLRIWGFESPFEDSNLPIRIESEFPRFESDSNLNFEILKIRILNSEIRIFFGDSNLTFPDSNLFLEIRFDSYGSNGIIRLKIKFKELWIFFIVLWWKIQFPVGNNVHWTSHISQLISCVWKNELQPLLMFCLRNLGEKLWLRSYEARTR